MDRENNEALLRARMREVVEKNPDIYGSTISFEPYTFTRIRNISRRTLSRGSGGTIAYVQFGSDDYVYWSGSGTRGRGIPADCTGRSRSSTKEREHLDGDGRLSGDPEWGVHCGGDRGCADRGCEAEPGYAASRDAGTRIDVRPQGGIIAASGIEGLTEGGR